MIGQRLVTNMPRVTPTKGGAKRAAIRKAREVNKASGVSPTDLEMDAIMAAELAKGALDDDIIEDANFDEVEEFGNDFFDGNYSEAKDTLAALKQLKTEASERRGAAQSNFRPQSMPRPTPALEEDFEEAGTLDEDMPDDKDVRDFDGTVEETSINDVESENVRFFAGVMVPLYIYKHMDTLLKTGKVNTGDGLADLVYYKWYENVSAIIEGAFKTGKSIEPIRNYTVTLVNILG